MKYRFPTILAVSVLALALAPMPAAADPTTHITPANPSMYVTVERSGAVTGQKQLQIKITRTDKPTGVMQSCSKVDYLYLESTTDSQYAAKTVGTLSINPPLCSFTKTVSYTPFSDDELRAVCVGQRARTVQHDVYINYDRNSSYINRVYIRFKVTAHVTCQPGATSSTAPSAGASHPSTNVRPVNACNFSGSWPVWQPSPGRPTAIPFALAANQGRSDVYQVSTPNNAGVSGSAVVNGYDVTIILQGNSGTMTLTGKLGRDCTTLHGQAIHSDLLIPWDATRRSSASSYTTQSVHSSRSRPAPAQARPRPAFAMPHVNTRVTPIWNMKVR